MKKTHKLIALSMGVLSLATVGLSACKGPTQSGSSNIPERDASHIYNGTHIYTATDTNEYFVKNGKTAYKLVVPEEKTQAMTVAQKEFVDLFCDATDIEIEVVTDDQVSDATEGKYISLGRTTLLKNSGIVVDKDALDNDGHRIVTKGDDVYICGGADEGSVFGVYTFMNLMFNYETFSYDCTVIDENVREKKLKNFDVTDIPDFKFRAHSSDATTYEAPVDDYDANMYAWRLGYYGKEASRGYYWLPVHEECSTASPKSASTNARRWFAPDIYWNPKKPDTYHPEWFSNNSTGTGKREMQLCFTAGKYKGESYELMVQTAFERVAWTLETYKPGKGNYPNANVMTLTHMDNMLFCTCSGCKEVMDAAGGSKAAVQILFMNDLAAKVDEWFEAGNCPEWKDEFKLLFFAYNHNYQPPAYFDAATKSYKLYPVDDEVDYNFKCSDRVIAWFCRESRGTEVFDGNKYFDASETNKEFEQTLNCWAAVADNMYYWNYGHASNRMFSPDTFQYLTSEAISVWCNASDQFWFTQYADNSKSPNTAWYGLRIYIDAKLSWDTSLSQGELVERWMRGMFKDAAPIMMQLYLNTRVYFREHLSALDEQKWKGSEAWPIGILNSHLKLIDDALAAIEHYKTSDPDLYDETAGHIELEAISYLYFMLQVHGNTISDTQKQAYVERIKYDIEWLDLYLMETEDATLPEWLADFE